ncbi:hypothetical protein CALCODRAFT_479374 [Calocera cornea HHB12733]|uniref:Uncharacterized protein n=1 Tax=Calocera cornea HHB12733 TaxID=1353952 RepID=A0A165JRK4_9BASI|nr:hypothetical protein CALCODRAFT_479374 [Calocera cornea HHB12733]
MEPTNKQPARRQNQWAEAVPDIILKPLVEKYYGYGFGDKKILAAIVKELNLPATNWSLS